MIKYLNTMLYTEEYLASQFTFGFELEGWVKNSEAFSDFRDFADDYFKDIPGKLKTLRDPCKEDMSIAGDTEECENCNGTGFYKTCDNCGGEGCEECDFTGGEMCEECDGKGFRRIRNGEYIFEWGSPIFNLTMENIKLILNFLDKAFDLSFETNVTCSTHIHIGFPDKTQIDKDMFWVLLNMIIEDEEKTIKDISKFKNFNFISMRYASIDYFKRAKHILMQNGVDGLSNVMDFMYNDSKYRMLRIHPQGTLEWRGPRNYMNSQNRKIIREFFLTKLYPFIKKISKFLDTKEINIKGKIVSKKEIYELLEKRVSPVNKKQKIRNTRFSQALLSDRNIGRYLRTLLRNNKWLVVNDVENLNIDSQEFINNDKLIITNGDFINTSNEEDTIKNIKFDGENVNIRNFKLINCILMNCNLNSCYFHTDEEILNIGTVEFNSCQITANKIINLRQSDTYGNILGGSVTANILKNITIANDVNISPNTLLEGCALHNLTIDNLKLNGCRIYGSMVINNSVIEACNLKRQQSLLQFSFKNNHIMQTSLIVTHNMINNKFENCNIKFHSHSTTEKIFNNEFINCNYWNYTDEEFVSSNGLDPKTFYEQLVKKVFNLSYLISLKPDESITDYIDRVEEYKN